MGSFASDARPPNRIDPLGALMTQSRPTEKRLKVTFGDLKGRVAHPTP
jgi:hypothetical protein